MAVVLKLSAKLVIDAKASAALEHRSVPAQIEYWARIGKLVLENSDVRLDMILDTVLSLEEAKAGLAAPYELVDMQMLWWLITAIGPKRVLRFSKLSL